MQPLRDVNNRYVRLVTFPYLYWERCWLKNTFPHSYKALHWGRMATWCSFFYYLKGWLINKYKLWIFQCVWFNYLLCLYPINMLQRMKVFWYRRKFEFACMVSGFFFFGFLINNARIMFNILLVRKWEK